MVNLGTFISVTDKIFTVSTRLSIHEEDTSANRIRVLFSVASIENQKHKKF